MITPGRIFTFGSYNTAYRFRERAKKLPSMKGVTIELICTNLIRGRRSFGKKPPTLKEHFDLYLKFHTVLAQHVNNAIPACPRCGTHLNDPQRPHYPANDPENGFCTPDTVSTL